MAATDSVQIDKHTKKRRPTRGKPYFRVYQQLQRTTEPRIVPKCCPFFGWPIQWTWTRKKVDVASIERVCVCVCGASSLCSSFLCFSTLVSLFVFRLGRLNFVAVCIVCMHIPSTECPHFVVFSSFVVYVRAPWFASIFLISFRLHSMRVEMAAWFCVRVLVEFPRRTSRPSGHYQCH